MNALHNFLFIALPYVALTVFFVGSIYKYRADPYHISSRSSQFLEGKKLFWGSVPFHFGMLVVFLLHLAAFLIPKAVLAWNSDPVRLIILETTGFIFALSFLFGLILLLIRRLTHPRIRVVTSWMDIVIEVLLLAQVILGCMTAVNYRWGSSWFASDLSPYLWSLVHFNPHMDAIKAMPLVVQLHVVLAYVIILMIPFTRLMHLLVAPLHYLFRPYQLVIWNWDRKKVNDPKSRWNQHQPKNT
jgi:nitrate reductase gamma subunit